MFGYCFVLTIDGEPTRSRLWGSVIKRIGRRADEAQREASASGSRRQRLKQVSADQRRQDSLPVTRQRFVARARVRPDRAVNPQGLGSNPGGLCAKETRGKFHCYGSRGNRIRQARTLSRFTLSLAPVHDDAQGARRRLEVEFRDNSENKLPEKGTASWPFARTHTQRRAPSWRRNCVPLFGLVALKRHPHNRQPASVRGQLAA
jgi:hypothetical protein